MGLERYVKMPCKWLSLHRGPCWGTWREFVGNFERKEKYILVPFLDPGGIQILSLGAMWNWVKAQGSPELIQDYGAQRACP